MLGSNRHFARDFVDAPVVLKITLGNTKLPMVVIVEKAAEMNRQTGLFRRLCLRDRHVVENR